MPLYGWLWVLTLMLVVATLSCTTALLIEKGQRSSCRPYFTPTKLPSLAKKLDDSCSAIEFSMWCSLIAMIAIGVLALGATLFESRRRMIVVVVASHF